MSNKDTKVVRTTSELIADLPDSKIAESLRALGLWTKAAHNKIDQRRPFPQNLATMESDALGNEQAWWSSEAGRIMELHGLLMGQKIRTDLEVKVALAKARASVRRRNTKAREADPEVKKMTATEVNDEAESEQILLDAREEAGLVDAMLASVAASKEATLLYLSTLSREITRRGDLVKGRL